MPDLRGQLDVHQGLTDPASARKRGQECADGVAFGSGISISGAVQLPFTREQFFAVFAAYNEAVWPAQVLLVLMAVAAVLLVRVSRSWSGCAITMILASLWSWLALAYHLAFFTKINPLAWLFAGMSIAAAVVFAWHGLVRRRLRFAWPGGTRGLAGAALIAFSLLVYPAWSVLAGHRYPAMPTFGLPCPTTIFTIGILAFLVPPHPRSVFVVPILWCLVGGQAAMLLGVRPDYALFAAGLLGLVLVLRRQ